MFTKCKFDAQGFFTKWKARLAGCGNEQLEETFGAGRSSPTANMLSINTLLCLGLKKKMVIWTSDVPGAYLHADLEEIMRLPKSCTVIWLKIMEIPESEWNLYTKKGHVFVRLKNALYGLVQSSLLWFKHISSTLAEMGFESCINDPCVFRRSFGEFPYYIALYVDDLLHVCESIEIRDIVADQLTSKYGVMDHHFGNQLSFLSMSILVNRDSDEIILDQDAYVMKFLETVDENCGKILQQYPATADIINVNETETLDGKSALTYRSYVMSILFVAIRTRPDVLLAIGVLSSNLNSPTKASWIALDHLIGYLRAHQSFKITYRWKEEQLYYQNRVVMYIDASWHFHSDGKGQSGCVIKIFGNSVFFRTSKQHVVTKSSTESEIVAVDDFLPYGIWISNLLRELNVDYGGSIVVFQDNTSGVKIIEKGHGNFKRTKHFLNKFYWIKQYVDDGTVEFVYLPTENMIADLFTKVISGYLFYVFVYGIMNSSLENIIGDENLIP